LLFFGGFVYKKAPQNYKASPVATPAEGRCTKLTSS
jgi:hypothetical protein